MALSVDFPAAVDTRSEIALFAVRPTRWETGDVTELARRLGFVGEVADRGLWHVVDDGRSTLEVYQATPSFRYGRRDTGENEAAGAVEGGLDADQARAVAEGWVGRFAPAGTRPDVHSVSELEVLVSERTTAQPRRLVAGLQVNYRFDLDGVALLGPGAKIQVVVDPAGEVSGAYRFWRDPRPAGQARTISVDEAYSRFAASDLLAGLTDDTARAQVDEVRLGYLSLPPTEPQGLLTPVFELRGVLSTELHPRHEFVSYVAAINLNDVDLGDGAAKGDNRWGRLRPSLVTA
ncbi:hypothetical protein [Frankia sp. AgKG'84/4]|uniref:hypothetical protein n=1 Tax=Frankia sp. AgKG'84/4 TaxID=573490 RepID=UPI00200F9013|nr:hypothetical protein [Frankia sp. AgKG'84/4]MCL9795008.1 hypothetical protein [Frankia sp. AgKG'84/4]